VSEFVEQAGSDGVSSEELLGDDPRSFADTGARRQHAHHRRGPLARRSSRYGSVGVVLAVAV